MSKKPRSKHEDLKDEDLVDLILSTGSSFYFEEIYERYAIKIYQKCLSFTKDEAEAKDVAHDVIVRIYLSLSKFGKKSKFSTWIYAVTYNHCVDYQAKKKKQFKLVEELRHEEVETKTEVLSDEDIMDINIVTLEKLLEKLSVAEKSLLLMKYQDGFSIKEIAELTGSGESAIKMKLMRTKAKLMTYHEEGNRKV